jgi:hypothetical protein
MAVPPPLPSLVAAAITSLSCLPLLTSLHLQSNARIEYTVTTAMTSMSGSTVARREEVGRINIATDDAEADNDGAWPFVFPPPSGGKGKAHPRRPAGVIHAARITS